MPALTSSMWAPAATCARASASTRLKSPAAISAARILRPVGLMRSPIMTKGRSKPITTSRVAELMMVSVILRGHSVGIELGIAAGIPRDTPVEHAGAFDDFRDALFLTVRHHMNPADSGDGADFLDEIDAEIAPFARGVSRARHARDDGVRDVQAGDVCAHPLRRLGGAQRTDADQDEYLLEQSEILDAAHEGLEQRHVVAVLSLDELRAGRDLLGEPLGAPFGRQREGVLRGTEQHSRGVSQLASAQEPMLIAHGPGGLEQR